MDEGKISKKTKKFVARMRDVKHICCLDTPTTNIALCNVGQATGLKKADIEEIVKAQCPEIKLMSYIAEKGESHSFIVFKNSKEAEIFFKTCNGKIRVNKEAAPVYMVYVDKVPNNVTICRDEKPAGLCIINNFITNEEESQLIKLFDWSQDLESSTLKNRQVKHYGYEFQYGSNDVDKSNPLEEKIPEECNFIWSRLKQKGINIQKPPHQLTVNKYFPGQGIPSHVDKHSPFSDTILSLSLGDSVVMDWRHHSGKYVPLIVPGRSMLVMKNEARYDWQHGIQSRTWDPVLEDLEENGNTYTLITNDTVERSVRISLTFRWINEDSECQCKYKTLCDSASKNTENLEGNMAAELEQLHVHQVYEKIAGHFSTTRHKPWPKVVEFMNGVECGSVVLDLGCGNGKNILKRGDIAQLACERSTGLLAECKPHISDISGADCVRLDLLHAALRDAIADVIICIAVIHHFSSPERRLQALNTISRLLKKGGKALITVWAKDQSKSNYLAKSKMHETNAQEKRVAVGNINLPVHENRTQFKHNDLLVPWKLRNVSDKKLESQPQSTLLRYYHVFEDNELVKLCEKIPELSVQTSFYEEGNWCVICTKR